MGNRRRIGLGRVAAAEKAISSEDMSTAEEAISSEDMSAAASAAVDAVEKDFSNNNEASKEPPKKRGSKGGPRQISYAIVGIRSKSGIDLDDVEVIAEYVDAMEQDKAREIFEAKHNIKPSKVLPAVFLFRGKKPAAKKVTVKLKSIRETVTKANGEQIDCIFSGWKCIGTVMGEITTKDNQFFKDGELVKLTPYQLADESKKVSKIKFEPNEVVHINHLQDVEYIEEEEF
jgi:hypothetical protein